MTNTQHRETAKIYQFPAGGRDALRASRRAASAIDEMERIAQRPVVGGSWYHEEAIRDAEPFGRR